MALVHRYMLDAEEAEARVQEAVEKTKTEAHRRSQVDRAVRCGVASAAARRGVTERARRESERARRTEQREREARRSSAGSTDSPADGRRARKRGGSQRRLGRRRDTCRRRVPRSRKRHWSESRPSLEPVTKEKSDVRPRKPPACSPRWGEEGSPGNGKRFAKAAAKRRLTGTYRS